MRPLTLLAALTTTILSTSAAPSTINPSSLAIPRALSAAAPPNGPCDAWSDECLEVITANACFAAYVPSKNQTQILMCVDVEDAAVAERKVSCHSTES